MGLLTLLSGCGIHDPIFYCDKDLTNQPRYQEIANQLFKTKIPLFINHQDRGLPEAHYCMNESQTLDSKTKEWTTHYAKVLHEVETGTYLYVTALKNRSSIWILPSPDDHVSKIEGIFYLKDGSAVRADVRALFLSPLNQCAPNQTILELVEDYSHFDY